MDKPRFIAYADPAEYQNLRRFCVESTSAESGSLDISSLAANVLTLSRPADSLIVRLAPAPGSDDDGSPYSFAKCLESIYERGCNRVESTIALAGKLSPREVSSHDEYPEIGDLLLDGLVSAIKALVVALLIASVTLLALF